MPDVKLLPPLTTGIHHGCLNCSHVTPTLNMRRVIAVGFGDAHAEKDGVAVYREPAGYGDTTACPTCPPFNDGYVDAAKTVLCGTCGGLGDVPDPAAPEPDYWTVSRVERLARQDPDHDWRIVLYGPLHGEVYQRHGKSQWVLVESNQGFA